eukprot:TRINITY_DN91108_c0_g1_i1.p1 TRINITY_DN91108_c0_g1~~TRINITY_DN91108_c0_g1_i1.p1  ORF type:complete len:531 (-),score=71.58 TRINITY_DN91108_c0_g1_i1:110-1672(-)
MSYPQESSYGAIHLDTFDNREFVVLNSSQSLPHIPMESEGSSWYKHLEVPASHPAARCLRSVQEMDDSVHVYPAHIKQEHGGAWRRDVLTGMKECRRARRKLYWVLIAGELGELHSGLHLGADFLEDATLICVPPDCNADAVNAWLAPVILIHRYRENDADVLSQNTYISWQSSTGLPLLSPSCIPGSGRFVLPQRLGQSALIDKLLVQLVGGYEVASNAYFMDRYGGDGTRRNLRMFHAYPQRLPDRQQVLAEAPALDHLASGAAVVFASDWRFSRQTAATIQRYLIRPLRAIVFAAMSGHPDSNGFSEKAVMSAAFPSLVGFTWVRDLPKAGIEERLSRSGSLDFYRALGGDALQPVNRPGGILQQLRKLEIALGMVQKYEELMSRRRFEWVVYSRTDMLWVAPHPPLALLDSNAMWFQETWFTRHVAEEYAGLQDWHATIPRRLVKAHLARWSLILSGKVPWKPGMNPEEFLGSLIDVLGIRLGFFPAVASLQVCKRWDCQFKGYVGKPELAIPLEE